MAVYLPVHAVASFNHHDCLCTLDAITKYCKLGGLNYRNLHFTILKAGKYMIEALTIRCLVRVHFRVHRWHILAVSSLLEGMDELLWVFDFIRPLIPLRRTSLL